ncbi:MAG: hypothetical protein D6750_08570 [Bacteroidetes bacterium]|nr:MAG: hypothetical protein D6750_08570 [Bacteroidota bacterium]
MAGMFSFCETSGLAPKGGYFLGWIGRSLAFAVWVLSLGPRLLCANGTCTVSGPALGGAGSEALPFFLFPLQIPSMSKEAS